MGKKKKKKKLRKKRPNVVRFFHWWPGRKLAGTNPIPAHLLRKAICQGSIYLTFASYDTVKGQMTGDSFCRKEDDCTKQLGRQIAVGRLFVEAGWHGIEIPFTLGPFEDDTPREE